ncbi:hypothetical protein [uncultured Variovorax sp.]|uniref:hypothetical protein n=1 Tax=uncultured Variovorax sp. TaxID=114708 RepID=UPI00260857B2|nr:hypothetical protein [uncultured Variovorax sp.]
MADQLAIWNVALSHVGERRLASLAEPREPARVLADEWDAAVRSCLQMTPWSFSVRRQTLSPTAAGGAGFTRAFQKPADWLRTADIATDVALTAPLDAYLEEGAFWFASVDQITVRYVSTDPNYGYNIAAWPQTFADLVALALAARICRRLTGSDQILGAVVKLRDDAQKDALALEEATAAFTYPFASVAGETRLSIYNAALAHLGRSRVYSLTQTTDTLRELNDQWRSAVRYCLQRGPWHFACRVYTQTPANGVFPLMDLAYAFEKPADWILTTHLAADPNLTVPVGPYVEDDRYWFANVAQLSIRYVSGDAAWGMDPSRWTPRFCDLVALRLAEVSCGRLAADAKDLWPNLVKLREDTESAALSVEAETVGRVPPPANGSGILPQLQVYNDALAYLGLPRVDALTVVSSTLRALNDQYDSAIRRALRHAPWFFAVSVVTVNPTPGLAGGTPFANGFLKPDDWIATLDLAQDPQITQPLDGYAEESGRWYADVPVLSARIISYGAVYGSATKLWPQEFVTLVALTLAELCAGRVGAGAMLQSITEKRAEAEAAAGAMELNTQARIVPAPSPEAAVRLEVLNGALTHLGRPRLAALTEARIDLRALNERFNDCVLWSLEQGPWTWATRTAVAQPAGYLPFNGFDNSFMKPDDWVKTVTLSASGDFLRNPLIHYIDADGIWYTRTCDLAVRYVSQSTDWGFNPLRWTPSFRGLLALRLAWAACKRLGGSDADLGNIVSQQQRAMKEARANDALNTAPVFAQPGSWVRSRSGWGGRRLDEYPDGGSIPLLPDGLGGASGRLGGSVADLGGADPGDPDVVDDQGRPVHTPGDGR